MQPNREDYIRVEYVYLHAQPISKGLGSTTSRNLYKSCFLILCDRISQITDLRSSKRISHFVAVDLDPIRAHIKGFFVPVLSNDQTQTVP